MNLSYRRFRSILTLAFMLVAGAGALFGQWTQVGSLNSPRSQPMNVWTGGALYTFGGTGVPPGGSAAQYLSIGEKFVFPPGTSSILANMPTPRTGGYAATINGKVYIVGGTYATTQTRYFTTKVLEYDPSMNTYAQKSDMTVPLYNVGGATTSSMIVLVGGIGLNQGQLVYTNQVQGYDPANDVWQQVGTYPLNAYSVAAAAVGNTIYAVGGVALEASGNNVAKAFKGTLSGSTITWTPIADYPLAVSGAASGVLNGVPYFAGGATSNGPTDRVYWYDAAANKWVASYALTTPTAFAGEMPSDGTSLYLVSGTETEKIYKLTLGTPIPIAAINRQALTITVPKGEQKQAYVLLSNKGVAPLMDTIKIADDAKAWLQTQSQTGTVAGGGQSQLILNADGSALDVGRYQTTVTIATNDEVNREIEVAVTVYVVPEGTTMQETKLVMEEASGQWCGPCGGIGVPMVRALKAAYGERMIEINYHDRGGRGASADLMATAQTEAINNWLGVPYFPAAAFQRWQFPGEDALMVGTGSWFNAAEAVFANQPEAPISIEVESYEYDAATKKITAQLKLTTSGPTAITPGQTLRLTTIVTEDSIQMSQAGSSENPFYHMDVVRTIGPSIQGQAITIPTEVLIDNGATMEPGHSFMVPVTIDVANVTNAAKAHTIFVAHLNNAGNTPGPILQGAQLPLTSKIGGGGGATYTINTPSAYKAVTTDQDTARFSTFIKNTGTTPIEFSIARTATTLPGAWTGTFCVNDVCQDVTSSTPIGPFSITPGDSIAVSLSIEALTTDGTGTVTLSFTGPNGPETQLYTVMATGATTGVPVDAAAGGMTLSQNVPNPATSATRLILEMPRAEMASVEIFSLNGERLFALPSRMMSSGANVIDLDVATLASGRYTVRVSSGNGMVQRVLTVVR